MCSTCRCQSIQTTLCAGWWLYCHSLLLYNLFTIASVVLVMQVLVFAPTNGKPPALNTSGEVVVVPSLQAPLWHEYQITTGFTSHVLQQLQAFNPTLIHIAIQDILGWRALLHAEMEKIPTVCSYHTRWTNYLGYYSMLPHALVDFGWWYLRKVSALL